MYSPKDLQTIWSGIALNHASARAKCNRKPCNCTSHSYFGKKLYAPDHIEVDSDWPLWSSLSWTQKKEIISLAHEKSVDAVLMLVSHGFSYQFAVQGVDFVDMVVYACCIHKVKPPSDHSGRKARDIIFCSLGRFAEDIIASIDKVIKT